MRRIKDAYYADKPLKLPPKLTKAFHEVIFEEVVKNPEGVKLPDDWGYMKIVAFQPTKALWDYGATNKYGKVIKHTNDETDGWVLKLHYYRHLNKKRPANSNGMSFKSHTLAKRAVKQAVKEWFKYDKTKNKV
jgi:hypothetical protein